jgi:prepilin-type N-terminal cleavage/methylation domain-containing protein
MRRQRGYTLIEMLVVIFIIGVLAALILGGLSAARRSNQIKRTEFQIVTLKARLSDYEMDFRDYPKTEGSSDDEDAIEGCETLLSGLRRDDKNGPYLQFDEYRLMDRDDDGLREIADVWGRPLRYLHHSSYGNESPCKRTFRIWSVGPDGISDPLEIQSDDITSWTKGAEEDDR